MYSTTYPASSCPIWKYLKLLQLIEEADVFYERDVIFYHVNCIQFLNSKLLNMFLVEYCTPSKKIKSAHHLERITVGYSWAYLSLNEQEMAYFSWVDPVPAREVANHMKLVWSSLFTRCNLHRWKRMGCCDEYSRALFGPPPPGNGGRLEKSWIHFIHQSQTKILFRF